MSIRAKIKKFMALVLKSYYYTMTLIVIMTSESWFLTTAGSIHYYKCLPGIYFLIHSLFKDFTEAGFDRCFYIRCSKNMHKIYRRTHIPTCDFNKVAKHTLLSALLSFSEVRNTLRHRRSPRNLLYISRTSFPKNISQRMLLTSIVLGNYCPCVSYSYSELF